MSMSSMSTEEPHIEKPEGNVRDPNWSDPNWNVDDELRKVASDIAKRGQSLEELRDLLAGRLLRRAIDAIATNGQWGDQRAIELVNAYAQLNRFGSP